MAMDNLKKTLPPLTSLVAFEAAARLGSFSDAARELNVTREAVSRQIRALESHLGMSLFERGANSTVLREWSANYFRTVSGSLEAIALASHAIRGEEAEEAVAMAGEDTEAEQILIVDDLPANIRRLHDVLRGRYEVIAYTDPHEALSWIMAGGRVELIMLDIRMAGMDGYALCRRIKAIPRCANVPILFLTGLDTTEDETEGFAAGACDYIVRPFAPPVLLARIRVQLDLRKTTAALEDLMQRRADRLEGAERRLAAIQKILGDPAN